MQSWAARTLITATLVAGALGAGAAPAAASDATLGVEVQTVLGELQPAVQAFVRANDRLKATKKVTELKAATRELRVGLRRYKWGTVNRKASGPDGVMVKKLLLSAVRQYDLGLIAFNRALVEIETGRSDRSIDASLATADRRLIKAKENEGTALTALGISVSSGVGTAFS